MVFPRGVVLFEITMRQSYLLTKYGILHKLHTPGISIRKYLDDFLFQMLLTWINAHVSCSNYCTYF